MDVVRRPRRGAAGWAVVMERWRVSGLSVEAFCQRDGVNRAGFYRWRALLSAAKPPAALAATPSSVDFVDLGVLGQVAAPRERLQLRLGLVLTLVRG
mgnify:FL=1